LCKYLYFWFIDLLLAELWLPRDWHRARTNFHFKTIAIIVVKLIASRSHTYALKGFIMTTGTVKWFNSTKGFGFIQPDNGGTDAFVHISAVERAGMREIVEGQKLSYDLERDNKSGKMSACNLQAV
jgi:CspA family cold shock protein